MLSIGKRERFYPTWTLTETNTKQKNRYQQATTLIKGR